VEGSAVHATIDTGATGVLALSTTEAARIGLLAPGRATEAAQSVSLGGLGFDRIVRVATLQAAGVTLRDAPVQIYAAAAGPAPSALLGVGFLKRFRVTLDLPARRLILTAPSLMVVPPP
jgi:predicted aspartyl protease